jgi:hypothetical protein
MTNKGQRIADPPFSCLEMRINDPRSKRAGLQGLALFGLGGLAVIPVFAYGEQKEIALWIRGQLLLTFSPALAA